MQTLDSTLARVQSFLYYDNGGASFDRFTVLTNRADWDQELWEGWGFSTNARDPQGFNQNITAKRGRHLGKRITYWKLPIDVKNAIMGRLTTEEI